jgi:hypothetical protein
MIERIVQDDARRDGPAARNGKGAARRGHCGAGEDGGVEVMAAQRRKRRSAASRNRNWTWPQMATDGHRYRRIFAKVSDSGILQCSAASRNRIRNCPQITRISADTRKALEVRRSQTATTTRCLNGSKQREHSFFPGFLRCLLFRNSSFAFIRVICGYMPFFLPSAGKPHESQKGIFAKRTQNEKVGSGWK